ncbi:Hydrogen peroxide-inducible genes activator [uncultured Candidatus Thioglobus sp.]|nr:Hydrogen peroxide-inducible genes activator [uncultured Candidatus Thioglobus sp.]
MPLIKNLYYLLVLKQHPHFSKVASACFVSQSTLSAGVNKLEQDNWLSEPIMFYSSL